MKAAPGGSIIETLLLIWQKILKQPSISTSDNFFDLGGDPALAVSLSSEIAKVCGHKLPPLIICQAPTVAAMAALLEQPLPPRIQPLVLVKEGAGQPPVFMAHGLGGSVMEFIELARHTQSPQPFYGLQAQGMDGMGDPLEHIEDMAQFDINVIKELQPHGPYHLIGYSLGGLVMLEIAQRLSRNGEKIGLLVMVDSYPHLHHLSLAQRGKLLMQQMHYRASALLRPPVRESTTNLVHPPERQLRILEDGNRSVRHRTGVSLPIAPGMQRVRDSSYLAWRRYRPRYYEGPVKFVRADVRSVFPANPVVVWGNLIAKLEVETAPGDHLGMITEHAASLARILSRYLAEPLC